MPSLPENIIRARLNQDEFNADELDAISAGTFLHPDTPQLPSRTGMGWRLFTRVEVIARSEDIGGSLVAYGEVHEDHDVFKDHFPNMKVLPGVYLQDQLLQMTGLLMGLHGVRGQGLARKSGMGEFKHPVTPETGAVQFNIKGTRFMKGSRLWSMEADGSWCVGGKEAGVVRGMKVIIIPSGSVD